MPVAVLEFNEISFNESYICIASKLLHQAFGYTNKFNLGLIYERGISFKHYVF